MSWTISFVLVFPSSRNESNPTTMNNHVTVTRKINPSNVKPVRKKTKLNILNEPSSRLAVYDEQINTTSSSSNQTTPRSTHPRGQQQIRSKPSTTLSHYSNQEQIRAHVNRSVVERQHLPPPPPRRGLIQQMIPFDASPSKVNNLLRHHHQQNQPPILFYPSKNEFIEGFQFNFLCVFCLSFPIDRFNISNNKTNFTCFTQ